MVNLVCDVCVFWLRVVCVFRFLNVLSSCVFLSIFIKDIVLFFYWVYRVRVLFLYKRRRFMRLFFFDEFFAYFEYFEVFLIFLFFLK